MVQQTNSFKIGKTKGLLKISKLATGSYEFKFNTHQYPNFSQREYPLECDDTGNVDALLHRGESWTVKLECPRHADGVTSVLANATHNNRELPNQSLVILVPFDTYRTIMNDILEAFLDQT